MKSLFKTTKRTISEINKHRKIVPLYQYAPQISERSYCFPNTTIIGQTIINSNSYIGSNTIIRGDMNKVTIEEEVFINENCSISTLPKILNSNELATLKIGNRSIIGSNCTLTSCIIEEKVFIGDNSVIGEGSLVRKGSIIAPNSVLPPNREIGEFEVWGGNPVRFVKKVSRAEKAKHVTGVKQQFSEFRRYCYEERAHGEAYLEFEEMEK